jgi:Ca2+-binding RTX toxin-like protein
MSISDLFIIKSPTLLKMDILAGQVLAASVASGKNPKSILEDVAKAAYLSVNPSADFANADTKANFGAFRHAYISAKISQYYGADVAKVMGDVGETFNPGNNNNLSGSEAQLVDDYNNDMGNGIGSARVGVNGLLGVDTALAQMLSDMVDSNHLATKASEIPVGYDHAPSLIGNDLLQEIVQSGDGKSENLKQLFDDYGWILDNPSVVGDALKDLLPKCLVPAVGMQQGNGGVMFPAGNGGGAEPLVLDLNGDGAHASRLGYGAGQRSHTYFDMDNDGFAERTAWATGGDGLLALDKNGNGKIDNQSELFGNTATYANGFLNLKQYDSNADNKITSVDAQFANLRVWVDADSDGQTDAGELKTLASLGITQINLNATLLTNTFDNENEVGATGTFVMGGVTRQVSDIWFRVDQTSTHYTGDVTLDVRTLFLPTLKGFGNLKDLHVAMSQDAVLLAKMQDFVTTTRSSSTLPFQGNAAVLNQKALDIFLRWAGVDGIAPDATTQGLNTQRMLFLETITGYKTSLLNNVPAGQSVGGTASTTQEIMFNDLVKHMTAQLTVQTLGSQLFDAGIYNIATGEFSTSPHLSAAGIAKIASDLSGLSYENKFPYWAGLTISLMNAKNLSEFTSDEISSLDTLWAGNYGQTWYQWARNAYFTNAWSFNGSNLSDDLVGIDHASNTIWGNGGDDYIKGGSATSWLYGGDGNDQIISGAGGDYISGDSGDDTIDGGGGNDLIFGGIGNDTYIIKAGSGIDIITDAAGNDTVSFDSSYNKATLTYRRSESSAETDSYDLNIYFGGTLAVVLNDYFSGTKNIETLKFSDGSTMSLASTVFSHYGTIAADALTGHNGIDYFVGGAGNDTLDGNGGSDTYMFNIGNGLDIVTDTSGTNDMILMGAGITASNVRLENSSNSLWIYYGTSDTIKLADHFADDTNGTSLYDEVETLKFSDGSTINLKSGLTFTGAAGIDSVNGTRLNDTLYGLAGNDHLYGKDGTDTLIGGDGNDYMDGGLGVDTSSYAGTSVGVTVSLLTTTAQNTVGAGTDTLTGIENLLGSSYNDTLTGDGNANTIDGGLGNDTLNGGAGVDTVSYSKATVGVTVDLSLATSQNTVGAGSDLLSNFENIFGSAFADTLKGNAGANVINGGSGNDVILGKGGNDTLYGGLGADSFKFDVSAVGNIDTVKDFKLAEADKLDIRDLLVGYDPLTKAITDFVECTTSGANTIVKVDRDGAGATYGWQQIAVLENVTGLTDEATLKANGTLIA